MSKVGSPLEVARGSTVDETVTAADAAAAAAAPTPIPYVPTAAEGGGP